MGFPSAKAQQGMKVASTWRMDSVWSDAAMPLPLKSLASIATLVLLLAGCAGTAMTTDPGTGALVPVQGWKSTVWYDDPLWRSSGSIGKDEFRQGPWWYGDPSWRFLSVGQGGIPGNRWGLVEAPAQPAPAAAEPAPAESGNQ